MTKIVKCKRCQANCRLGPVGNPKAKMLRYSNKGLCINCAVHDWLRNTYPINMQLAEYGSKGLLLPHIQKQFAGIMRIGFSDAKPDEIDWNLVVENWDLPFPHKVKPTATNPCTQRELDEITAGNVRG